jgi:hypothetical protein
MRVLVPIAHNAHHDNEPDICSGILFFNDECIPNMHHMILIGRLYLQLLSAVLYEFSSTTIMTSNSNSGSDRLSGSGYVFGNDNIEFFACLANSMGYSYRTDCVGAVAVFMMSKNLRGLAAPSPPPQNPPMTTDEA